MSGKPAARMTDPTACPVSGHGVNPVVSGSPDVLFDGLPATRQGDLSACGAALEGNLSSTVFINGLNAATAGSVGAHGNAVIGGSGTVIIGDVHVPAPFVPPAALSLGGLSANLKKPISAPSPLSDIPIAGHPFDLYFLLTDATTGRPLPNTRYRITLETGEEIIGTSVEPSFLCTDVCGH